MPQLFRGATRQGRTLLRAPGVLIAGALLVAALTAVIWNHLPGKQGGSPRELTIGLDPHPPFQYWDAQGRARGAMPELLEVASRRAGIRLRWVPFEQSPERALRPETGISLWPLVQVRAGRRSQFHITQPFARAETLLVRLKGTHRLPVKRLGVGVRPEAKEWSRKHFPQARLERPEDTFGMEGICNGTLDATLVETPAFDSLLMNRPASCEGKRFDVRLIFELKTDYALGATFAAADAADQLRHHLGEMAREGLLDEIFQAYYPLAHYRSPETFAETETERTRRMVRWGAIGLASLCAVLWMGLQRSRRNASAALAMADLRSQFLASISHELRTPLNGVLGLASALDATNLDRAQREYVGLIRSSGEILLRTVNEVLDFSRLEAGKQVAAQEPVALSRLVESVVSVLAPVAQQKGLELQWAVDKQLPASIQSDESALRQILMNLVGNGIKFTARGYVAVEARLEKVDKSARLLRLAVSDSGPGVPAGQEEAIFDPFVRGTDLRTQAIVGTGLGLSIAKRLVLLMGGSIRARNKPAGGCTFEVLLPLAEANTGEELRPACRLDKSIPERALLATRQPLALEMLGQHLEAVGSQVRWAPDDEALREAMTAGDAWSLIVLDDSLIEDHAAAKTILTLAEELRHSPPARGAIFICATNEDLSEREASDADAGGWARRERVGCYRKPFLPELFCSLLESMQATNGAQTARNLMAATRNRQPDALANIGAPPPTREDSETEERNVWQGHGLGPSEAMPGLRAISKTCKNETGSCLSCGQIQKGKLAPCLTDCHPADRTPLALVVDDNPVNRKVLVSLLRGMGLGCDTAASGEEAIRLFGAQVYSWVLMDWHMPGMDGLEAIRRMREREAVEERSRTPIVLCTASAENDPGLGPRKGLLDAVLPKPITFQSLRDALRASALGRTLAGSAPGTAPTQTMASPPLF